MKQATDDLDITDVPDSVEQKGYTVLRQLGAGGYAQVYLAHQEGNRYPEAIKILHTRLARDPDSRRTFLDEADKLRKISRDRIISAHIVHAREGDVPWFAMDYADGGTLDSWVEGLGRRLELAQLVGLGVEICKCLVDLHDYEIVHFDLKPHNVLLRTLPESVDRRRGGRYRLPSDQQMVLSDLGMARASREVHEQIGGTQQYIAPETFRGAGSERSDLFALGMMLYQFAHPGSGNPPVRPYDGRVPSSKPEIRLSLQETDRWGSYHSLKEVRPDLPKEFDDLVARLLAPDPNDRFHGAHEAGQALDQLLRTPPRSPPSIDVTSRVDGILTETRALMDRIEVGGDTYESLEVAEDRLARQRPRIAVIPAGAFGASAFTLYLAGEPESVEVPEPYGSVITYVRYGSPERAITEGRPGERFPAEIQRDNRNNPRANLHLESARRLILELDHDALQGLEFLDLPAEAVDSDAGVRALSKSDIVIVMASRPAEAGDALQVLRKAARRSLAGPLGFVVVDAEPNDFKAPTSTVPLEERGFHMAIESVNAGLALRVFFKDMLDESRGQLIAASGALALCDSACSRTNEWSIARNFIDRRDMLEHEFPDLRDLRYLREESRGEFHLATDYARELRRILAQPTPAGKLGLASDETDVPTIRRAAEERLFDWMTALANGTIPADSAGAARAVVAALRRLQDAENV